jgi:excisionase family DNA binding protein
MTLSSNGKTTRAVGGATEHSEDAPRASTVREFCERYRLSRTTVYHLASSKQLRVVKVRGKSLVLAEDEARWLASLPEVGASRRPA